MKKYLMFKEGSLFDICDTKEKALIEKEFFDKINEKLTIKEVELNELESKIYEITKMLNSSECEWSETTYILMNELKDTVEGLLM